MLFDTDTDCLFKNKEYSWPLCMDLKHRLDLILLNMTTLWVLMPKLVANTNLKTLASYLKIW